MDDIASIRRLVLFLCYMLLYCQVRNQTLTSLSTNENSNAICLVETLLIMNFLSLSLLCYLYQWNKFWRNLLLSAKASLPVIPSKSEKPNSKDTKNSWIYDFSSKLQDFSGYFFSLIVIINLFSSSFSTWAHSNRISKSCFLLQPLNKSIITNHLGLTTSLDFNYVKPCLDLVQF